LREDPLVDLPVCMAFCWNWVVLRWILGQRLTYTSSLICLNLGCTCVGYKALTIPSSIFPFLGKSIVSDQLLVLTRCKCWPTVSGKCVPQKSRCDFTKDHSPIFQDAVVLEQSSLNHAHQADGSVCSRQCFISTLRGLQQRPINRSQSSARSSHLGLENLTGHEHHRWISVYPHSAGPWQQNRPRSPELASSLHTTTALPTPPVHLISASALTRRKA
jgi:hypothetical protein